MGRFNHQLAIFFESKGPKYSKCENFSRWKTPRGENLKPHLASEGLMTTRLHGDMVTLCFFYMVILGVEGLISWSDIVSRVCSWTSIGCWLNKDFLASLTH